MMAVSQAYYLLLVGACGATVLLSPGTARGGDGFPLLGLGIIAYFTLLALVFYGGARYHFPIMPWVAMYAAALPDVLLGWRRTPATFAAGDS